MKKYYEDREYLNKVYDILNHDEFKKMENIVHHGVNRLNHSIRVSYYSYKIAKLLRLDSEKVARAALHYWEEPCISGEEGSGTIFFSNCNLKCLYCQNKKISTGGYGKEIDNNHLIDIMFELQNKGAHNINFVTPTHYVPQIIECLKNIKLDIPIVYNTSSYENVETIKMLNGYIDIYLADLKYYDNELGQKYSNCKDYFK